MSLSFFKDFFFFFFLTFNLLLSNFLLLLLGFIVVVFFFLSKIFSFLTGLSSLLWPLGFWHLALPVGVCSLECNNMGCWCEKMSQYVAQCYILHSILPKSMT